jgi:hypothetical protein
MSKFEVDVKIIHYAFSTLFFSRFFLFTCELIREVRANVRIVCVYITSINDYKKKKYTKTMRIYSKTFRATLFFV